MSEDRTSLGTWESTTEEVLVLGAHFAHLLDSYRLARYEPMQQATPARSSR